VEIQDIRRRALRHELDRSDRWRDPRTGKGSVSAFAKSIGKSQPLLADVLRGEKPFGEKLARDIEKRAGFASMSLDKPPTAEGIAEPPATYVLHGLPVSAEEVDVGREWGKLHEPLRSQWRLLLEMIVAEQVRDDRKPRKSPKKRPHNEHRPQLD
jgi:hypothetical protein